MQNSYYNFGFTYRTKRFIKVILQKNHDNNLPQIHWSKWSGIICFPVSVPTLKLDSNKIIEFSMVWAVFPSIVFGEEVRTLHHQHPNSIPETVDSMEHLYAPSYLRSPVCFLLSEDFLSPRVWNHCQVLCPQHFQVIQGLWCLSRFTLFYRLPATMPWMIFMSDIHIVMLISKELVHTICLGLNSAL